MVMTISQFLSLHSSFCSPLWLLRYSSGVKHSPESVLTPNKQSLWNLWKIQCLAGWKIKQKLTWFVVRLKISSMPCSQSTWSGKGDIMPSWFFIFKSSFWTLLSFYEGSAADVSMKLKFADPWLCFHVSSAAWSSAASTVADDECTTIACCVKLTNILNWFKWSLTLSQ